MFKTTQWSLVIAAGEAQSPETQKALEALIERYWEPVYIFIRKRGSGIEDAQDLTQSFFAHILQNRFFKNVNCERGKFRSYLLTSLSNYLSAERKKGQTIKRGGDKLHLSLDYELAENHFHHELTDQQTPEKAYERSWALSLLKQVVDKLKSEYAAKGKTEIFAYLHDYIIEGDQSVTYAQAAQHLNMSKDAVKAAARRLRNRYGDLLREEIAQTVTESSDIEAEILQLLAMLR